jgi:hypothetical protein
MKQKRRKEKKEQHCSVKEKETKGLKSPLEVLELFLSYIPKLHDYLTIYHQKHLQCPSSIWNQILFLHWGRENTSHRPPSLCLGLSGTQTCVLWAHTRVKLKGCLHGWQQRRTPPSPQAHSMGTFQTDQ